MKLHFYRRRHTEKTLNYMVRSTLLHFCISGDPSGWTFGFNTSYGVDVVFVFLLHKVVAKLNVLSQLFPFQFLLPESALNLAPQRAKSPVTFEKQFQFWSNFIIFQISGKYRNQLKNEFPRPGAQWNSVFTAAGARETRPSLRVFLLLCGIIVIFSSA